MRGALTKIKHNSIFTSARDSYFASGINRNCISTSNVEVELKKLTGAGEHMAHTKLNHRKNLQQNKIKRKQLSSWKNLVLSER